MKCLFVTALGLFLLTVWQIIFYQNVFADSYCGNNSDVVVVFGNGILNTEKEADRSKNILKEKLRESLSPEEFSRLEFKLAYNHSYGFMSDLYESLKQRVVSDNYSVSFWRWMGNLDVLPDAVQEEILDMVSNFDVSEHFGTEDIENHLALYRTAIAEGKMVIVVSHSQGNFFANAVHQILYEGENPLGTKSFGIVSVANPASHVAGSGSYTTLVEDAVIGAIAATASAIGTALPLAANETNIGDGSFCNDWKNHGFLEAYFAEGSNSEGKILDNILSEMESLEPPNQIAQDGIITVTLTWGNQPDVDLHLSEPNGTHVFYRNLTGPSGYLDLDDVDGYGPEHYYVSCDTLENGTYRVGVNYFKGSYPEQAIVQIKAGASIRSFPVNLASAVGSNGDDHPINVAEIEVTGNDYDGFTFEIQSAGSNGGGGGWSEVSP